MAAAKKRAYNRRKPTDSVLAESPVSKVSLKDPVAMRHRIAQINQIAADLHKERTALEEAITGLGFKMIDDVAENPDPKNWKKGDVLRCINEDGNSLTEGKLYIADENTTNGFIQIYDDDGDSASYRTSLFVFVTR